MTQVPTIARPPIRSPRVIGSGVMAASTSRGATSTPLTVTWSVRSMPRAWIVFSLSMKSSPSAYLNVTFAASGSQRGTSRTSSCSTFTHSIGPMPSGNGERLRAAERLGRVPAAVRVPHDRRVEALLDRRPDAEHRGEGVAGDLEVAAVADVDLVDLVEQVLRGVRGEDVGQAGVHAHPQQRELAATPPRLVHGELLVAELHARQSEGPIGCGAERLTAMSM